jgi:hypothetical protein
MLLFIIIGGIIFLELYFIDKLFSRADYSFLDKIENLRIFTPKDKMYSKEETIRIEKNHKLIDEVESMYRAGKIDASVITSVIK